MFWRHKIATVLLLTLLPGVASAAWIDGGWPYRRAIDVEWPNQPPFPEELAMVDIYTAGHHQSSQTNIRVAADDGRTVPCRVLMIGPGDKMRIAFAPARGTRRYYVYFGHTSPPPPRPRDELTVQAGMLMEMRKLSTGFASNFRQIEDAYNSSKELIGRTIVSHPYIGLNPFNDETSIISRYSGSFTVLQPGQYTIAASASDRAAVFLDGKPLVIAHSATPDSRFNAKVDLTRGKHDLVVYHMNLTGEQRLTVAWQPPSSPKFDVIPPQAFGLLAKASAGPMEQKDRLTADFKIEYLGECFFNNHYAHRYRFTAASPTGRGVPSAQWDFGDGQTSASPTVEHVYLVEGLYPVKLTVRSGNQSDIQTHRISVSRLFEKLDNPPTDVPSKHSAIVAQYDVAKLSPAHLPWAALLHVRTKQAAPLEKAALRLATVGREADSAIALWALQDSTAELAAAGKPDIAARVWEAVPADSPLQPRAAQNYAKVLLWQLADFSKAEKVLAAQLQRHAANPDLKRSYAQAMLLNQKSADAIKLFNELPNQGPADRQSAIAGALARTIEYYIAEKDPEPGEQTWEKWQQQYPADFLEGYSVLLQTRLMELRGAPASAARVAEAFALAMPRSSYTPRLLDRASKLLERLDPHKSKALRATLKQKYPEDPLSQ